MKQFFVYLLFFDVSLTSFSQENRPKSQTSTLQSVISNSANCINVQTQGNSNHISIYASENTKKLLNGMLRLEREFKKSNRLNDTLLSTLKLAISKLNNIDEALNLILKQLDAADKLKILSNDPLIPDSIRNSIQKELFVISTETKQLKCSDSVQLLRIGEEKFLISERKDLTKEDVVIFETTNSNNRLLFRYKNKFGFLDSLGNIVIPPRYDTACGFSESLAYVKQNNVGEWFIDKNDKPVIDISKYNFSKVGSFHDGVALVEFGDNEDDPFHTRFNYLDNSGNLISTENFYFAYDFSFGLGCVQIFRKDAYNYLDTITVEQNNNFILPLMQSENYVKQEKINELFKLISNANTFVKQMQNDKSSASILIKPFLVYPKTLGELLSFVEKRNLSGKNTYDLLKKLKEKSKDVRFLRSNKLVFGYIDNKGEFKIRPKFYLAEPFDYFNTARTVELGCYHNDCIQTYIINRTGEKKGNFNTASIAIDQETGRYYVGIYPFENSSCSYTPKYVLDTAGNTYYFNLDAEIIALRDNFIICQDYDEKQALYTVYGLEVLAYRFKDITFEKDNIIIAKTLNGEEFYYYLDPIGKATLIAKKE